MGKFYDSCPEHLLEWIEKQRVFWVATAPLSAEGHVNVSPKGAFDCFHIIGPNKVWYEDYTGSGNETISHLKENKRITIMFTAFDGPPRIVRLFGTGTSYEYGTPEYEEFIPKEQRKPGSRAAIVIDVHKVGSSCGYSVPYYDFKGDRMILFEFARKLEDKADSAAPDTKVDKGIREYWATTNAESLDGLPGLETAPNALSVPSTTWSREEELARSHAKVPVAHSDGKGTGVKKMVSSANVGPMLVAAFTMGVFATLICVRMAPRFTV